MRWVPRRHHAKALRFAIERACAGLFLDPGLGKTSVMLALMSILKKQKLARAALVVAPLRVAYSVWPVEAQKWDEFRALSVAVLHGPEKDARLREAHDLYVVNYEGLPWLTEQIFSWKSDLPFDVLIVDESSRLKDTRTRRFKMLRRILALFRRRYILTGSPAPNTLLDLFGQMFIMDAGATWRFITKFRDQYFSPTGYGGYEWVLKDGAEDKIYEAIAPRALRLALEDYQELPERVETDVLVELPDDARKAYDQMENVLMAQLEDDRIVAANAAVATSKCLQIAGGAIYRDDLEHSWTSLHDAKLEALQEVVEEFAGQPAMIVYQFTHELERMRRLFPGAPVLGDRTSAKKGAEIEAAWNRGEVPILFVHPKSAGHGLNMQEAGRGQIWFTPTWSFEEYDQTFRRMWRSGRKEPVFVHRILARRTVDEAVVAALRSKKKGQDALLGALRDYWRGRKT